MNKGNYYGRRVHPPAGWDGRVGAGSEDPRNNSDPLYIPTNITTMVNGEGKNVGGAWQFAYKDNDLKFDKRSSHASRRFPYIEAVHKFCIRKTWTHEWDSARFTIPCRRGPGRYIIHMIYGGYRDAVDVNCLPSPANDIYGTMSHQSVVKWTKIDNCQVKPEGIQSITHRPAIPPHAYQRRRRRGGPTCFLVKEDGGGIVRNTYTNKYDGIEQCKQWCDELARTGDCDALNVVPLINPAESAFPQHQNIPWCDHDCYFNVSGNTPSTVKIQASYVPATVFEMPEWANISTCNKEVLLHNALKYYPVKAQSKNGGPWGSELDTTEVRQEDYDPSKLFVCYALKMAPDRGRGNTQWEVSYDPQDPVFHSTCHVRAFSHNFIGNPVCHECMGGVPPQKPLWRYGNRCIPCEARDKIMSLGDTQVANWSTTDRCTLCSEDPQPYRPTIAGHTHCAAIDGRKCPDDTDRVFVKGMGKIRSLWQTTAIPDDVGMTMTVEECGQLCASDPNCNYFSSQSPVGGWCIGCKVAPTEVDGVYKEAITYSGSSTC